VAKARRQKLKVFRTPVGFDDAYVAAPSRKAALEAWGASTDLFSAGIAEEVKETSAAAKKALARPGEVVREGRQVPKEEGGARTRSAAPKKATPKPSRAAVERAESALAKLEAELAAERDALAKEEEKLARRHRAMEEKHRKAREKAEAKRDAAKERYRQAMAEWVG
jgi:hypothetical protein